jgi:predicted ATPase
VSSFIGRHVELARVAKALEETRLVTLTGVGGVGKTRLALHVAAEVLPRFREGAWLVELAPIRDSAAVAGAVATVFGLGARRGLSVEESLVEFLRTKQLLLIVDNCEHVLEAVTELIDVLERACGGLVVLATSREGLALDGERVVPVPSMKAPSAGTDLVSVVETDAVRLFVDRAQWVDPDFEVSAGNVAAVVEVCQRVDGVPLAIELAAVRVATMTPAELAAGLDRRLATLAGGRRRSVQRHQTLRAAIDWSYDLLGDGERVLLARLAVFAGGCTRSAAEAVCGAAPIAPGHVFDLLAGLVAKSLVVAHREGSETRYRLLETIREYGEERLAELHETEYLRRAYSEYFWELGLALKEELDGPNQLRASRRFAAEYENLLAGVSHAIDTDDVDLGLRLLCATPPPGVQVGYRLLLSFDGVLGLTGAAEHPLYPLALAAAAYTAARQGDVVRGTAACEEALAAATRLGADPDHLVEELVWRTRAAVAVAKERWDDAAAFIDHTVELARACLLPARSGALSHNLAGAAFAHMMAGQPDIAAPLAREGLEAARDLGAPAYIVMNLIALAGALADQDPAQARALLAESLELRASLDFEGPNDATQSTLIAARVADWPLVLRLAPDAIRQLHWAGHRPSIAEIVTIIARAMAPGDPESAAALQGVSRRFVPDPFHAGTANGAAHADAGSVRDHPPGTTSFVTELGRQTTSLLDNRLGAERLDELRAQGEAMEPDDAVRWALALIEGNLAPH